MLSPSQFRISQIIWLTSLSAMVIGLMVLLVESARVGDESMLAVEEQAIVEQLRSIGLSVDDRFT